MANLTQTLISKVNQLTTLVNSIMTNAKKIGDLPDAATPLNAADYIHLSQSGNSVKAPLSTLPSTGTGSFILPYQQAFIYKASGNINNETLEVGDLVTRWWNATEYWHLARYDGGTTTLRASYTIITSTEDL